MRRSCKQVILCDGIGPQPEPDWPVTNYSAEAPDPLIFAAISYPQIGTEPIGCFYTVGCTQALSVSCHGVTYSAESQEQADALALAASIYCPSNDTGSEGAIYSNDAATATLKCPNGTAFTYTVEAGTMVSGLLDDVVGAAWKEAADQWAHAYAMQMAAELMTCVEPSRKGSGGPASNLAGNPGYACIGETLLPEENTYAVGNPSGRTFVFSISGTLPPGVTFSQASPTACELSGTPTTAGIFTFTITAVSTALPTISLSVTDVFYIPGITNPTLADGIAGDDYGPEQLLTSGTVGAVTFSLVPGSTMPDTLTLHSDGTIDGTTETAGDYTFDVIITDADGRECTQTVMISVTAAPYDCSGCTQTLVFDSSTATSGGGVGVPDPTFTFGASGWTGSYPAYAGPYSYPPYCIGYCHFCLCNDSDSVEKVYRITATYDVTNWSFDAIANWDGVTSFGDFVNPATGSGSGYVDISVPVSTQLIVNLITEFGAPLFNGYKPGGGSGSVVFSVTLLP